MFNGIHLLGIILFFLFTVSVGYSQPVNRVEFPSSPNPIGSGARALGMGGAFIAVADDATAASWNPGGLIQLERPEISVVGTAFHRREENRFQNNPEASGAETVSDGSLNYLSATIPFVFLNRPMVVSINYQHLFDFSREASFALNSRTDNITLNQIHDLSNGRAVVCVRYCLLLSGLTFIFHWRYLKPVERRDIPQ